MDLEEEFSKFEQEYKNVETVLLGKEMNHAPWTGLRCVVKKGTKLNELNQLKTEIRLMGDEVDENKKSLII